ncbi:MAG: hypothetical protein H6831_09210 [Planctomycetes bacterium]|nr:hypothetical protein [Planctomycetota bacterium]MCB9904571.1 hypothetical protein [Planctomycetota bacterium]
MTRFLLLLCLFSLTACRSTSERLDVMVDETRRDLASGGAFAGTDEQFVSEQQSRISKVRGFQEAGELESAKDYYNAAWILISSQKPEDLVLARDLAQKSVELGEDRAFRVMATAVDKLCRIEGKPQRYGTQYEYIEFLRRWRLYPVDPATTDAERESMGIQPLRELYEREDWLNEQLQQR